MLNFLFCGHDLKFLSPVIDFVKSMPNVAVVVQQTRGHKMTSAEEIEAQNNVVKADIVFCEWALGNAVWYSHHKRDGQVLIVRMHAQEFHADLPYLAQMDFTSIDALVVICQEAVDYMAAHYPKARVKLIYNPIDVVTRFSCAKRAASDHHLGFLGMVPFMKRPDLALEIFEKCVEVDRYFKLYIKGKRPADFPWMASRKDEMAQYEERFDRPLEKSPHKASVYFDGFDPDPGAWYAKCGFILSTSDFEGSHQAVAEGMAQGCIPIIRDWKSADRLYPKKYVWHDVKDAVRKILDFRRSPTIFFSEMQRCRQYALRHFDARAICLQYDELFSRHPAWRSVRKRYPLKDMCVAQLVWIPAGCHNGYRVRVEKFSAQYKKLGMRTVLICLHDGKASAEDLKAHKEDFERLGCHAYVVPVQEFFASKVSVGAQEDIVRKLKPILDNEHVDVLQCHALYCGRIGKFLKAARPETLFSCVFHGVNPEEAAMSGSAPARVKMLEELEWDLLKSVDFANYVSKAMEAHYLAKYGLLRPSCIVPSALRKEALRVNIKNRRILSLPKDRPTLGYCGTLVAWQCKDEMFTLFGEIHKRHKDVFFPILTQKPYHEEVHRLMSEHGIGRKDYLVQEVAFDDVSAAVSQFNAGVMLRKWSPVNRVASPTKFGEMIAAGVPIVATDGIGDFSEDVRKNDFGTIVPLQELDSMNFSQETCDAVYGLLMERRNESKEFIDKAMDFCRANLIWEEHVARMAEWYWKLLVVKVDGSPAPLPRGDEGFPARMSRMVDGMPISNGCRYYEKFKTRIGIICDEFYWDSVKAAADFTYISCDDWQEKIKDIDVLYLVSAWHGLKNDDWLNLSREGTPKRKIVYSMIDECRKRHIPVVFYSKEDPPNYDRFVGIAQHSDYVFTSCEEVIPKYVKDCGHERVYAMRFGINPVEHNPVGRNLGNGLPNVIFSGSWMMKYPDRCNDLCMLFDGISAAGKKLDIVARNYDNRGNPAYRWPDRYLSMISPAIPHDVLQKIHRLYDWAININSVQDSRTMFANRVYELQACGNLLLSNYSLGVSETFPGVFIAKTKEDVANALSLSKSEIARRQAAGIRRVMTGETCFDRIAFMLNKVGLPAEVTVRRILAVAHDIKGVQRIFDAQTYPNKILRSIKEVSFEDLAKSDIIAFFDKKEKYNQFYLEDMANAFKYTNCAYVCKANDSKGNHYVSRIESKWRTLFWRTDFDVRELLSKSDSFDFENGFQIQ